MYNHAAFTPHREKDNGGRREDSCVYRRDHEEGFWHAQCGFKLRSIGRDYQYCPGCGRKIRRAI